MAKHNNNNKPNKQHQKLSLTEKIKVKLAIKLFKNRMKKIKQKLEKRDKKQYRKQLENSVKQAIQELDMVDENNKPITDKTIQKMTNEQLEAELLDAIKHLEKQL